MMYPIIISVIAVVEGFIIFKLLTSRPEVRKLRSERNVALIQIKNNMNQIAELEKQNQDIKNEATKIDNPNDAFNFLRNIADQ